MYNLRTSSQSSVGQFDVRSPRFQSNDGLRARADRLRGWLGRAALPLWSGPGLDQVGGGFEESLGQDGVPVPAPRRVRVQSRQVYSFATAGLLGWEGPWRAAATSGLKSLMGRYRRPDGLYRSLVSVGGQVIDDTPRLYEQAFVLLALARMTEAGGAEPSLEAEAVQLRSALRRFKHGTRGYRERSDRPFQSNAHMHLLEACMAWMQVSNQPEWREIAEEIVELCLTRFIEPASGCLLEVFDEDWRPAGGALGSFAEPGHQFEWSWLLQRWGQRTGQSSALIAAEQLRCAGLQGIDPDRKVAVDEMSILTKARSETARFWPQTEWLKASLHRGEETGDWRPAEEACDAVLAFLATPVAGLWWDRMLAGGAMRHEAAPASSLYHVVTACAEVFRVIGERPGGALSGAVAPMSGGCSKSSEARN